MGLSTLEGSGRGLTAGRSAGGRYPRPRRRQGDAQGTWETPTRERLGPFMQGGRMAGSWRAGTGQRGGSIGSLKPLRARGAKHKSTGKMR